ncbi:hypothetical protein J4558_06800 [Leptolyngbya sp. 15MV]|nr:hypothetical protein J4558_06800 [Leptolyngbya sp. 15MV]
MNRPFAVCAILAMAGFASTSAAQTVFNTSVTPSWNVGTGQPNANFVVNTNSAERIELGLSSFYRFLGGQDFIIDNLYGFGPGPSPTSGGDPTVTPWGTRVTPFTYGESVEGNSFTFNNYVRKDTFANRDALDLNGAGQLRSIINAAGLGDWANVLAAHLDNADDGLNNNTLGVNHVFSHDNGSVGDGSSQPPIPTYQQQGWATHAYLLLRGGLPIVYHNARGITRPGGFWPREGLPIALGMDPFTNAPNTVATTLVRLQNNIGRGDFRPLTSTTGGGSADVLVFERFRNPGGGQPILANAIVGVNDRYDAGSDLRTVTTSFPQGQVLVEQTGNADDPVVDPTNAIPSTITVGAGGSVSIRVPRNASTPTGGGTTVHHRGFVVYAPAIPQGAVTISPVASTIAPDPSTVPLFRRRTTAVPVVTAGSFTLELATTPAIPLSQDPDVDDNAVFRFNRGFVDLNGNGQVDFGPGNDAVAGFELFNTLRQPGTTQPSGLGLYRQTISTALLPEGYNYITVRAFKRRPASTDPLWREVRQVVYVDRLPPEVSVTLPPQPVQASSALIRARAADRTASNAWVFANLPQGVDPTTLVGPLSQMVRVDRFDWQFQVDGLSTGQNRVTVVAGEDSGRLTVVFDGSLNVQLPCYANCDGSTAEPRLTPSDFVCFLNKYRAGDPYANCDGSVGTPILTPSDFICFLAQYRSGCP